MIIYIQLIILCATIGVLAMANLNQRAHFDKYKKSADENMDAKQNLIDALQDRVYAQQRLIDALNERKDMSQNVIGNLED